MTIAGFSAISAKPVLDEARRFCTERGSSGPVCGIESNMGHAATAQQANLPISKDPSAHGSVPASAHLPCEGSNPPSPRLAFVYGTLKRGFGNHWLMEELMAGAHARFLGFACTKRRFPLVCGPFQVPFLLPSPSPQGHQVRGELYQVDSLAISRLDELEGVSKGHYQRQPLDIFLLAQSPEAGMHMHQGNNYLSKMHPQLITEDVDPSNQELDMSYCALAGPSTSCRLYMDPLYLDEIDTKLLSTLAPESSDPSEYLHAEAYFACPSYGLQMAECAPHLPCYTEKEASTYVRRKDRPHGRTFLEHIHAWIEENGLIYT